MKRNNAFIVQFTAIRVSEENHLARVHEYSFTEVTSLIDSNLDETISAIVSLLM